MGKRGISLFLAFLMTSSIFFQLFLSQPAGANYGGGRACPYKMLKQLYNPNLGCGDNGKFDDTQVISGSVLWDGSEYTLYYTGVNASGLARTGMATSTDRRNWTRFAQNPVLNASGSKADWDGRASSVSSVIKDGSTYKMWYVGSNGTVSRLGYASSTDGTNWTKYASNPVMSNGSAGSWDGTNLTSAWVILEGGIYRMWYTGFNGSVMSIGYATSEDGLSWSKSAGNPILASGASGTFESSDVGYPTVCNVSGELDMWYCGRDGRNWSIGFANSTDGLSWSKYKYNPVVKRGVSSYDWDERHAYHPAALYNGSAYLLWYTGVSLSNVTAIGRAEGWNTIPDSPQQTKPVDSQWYNDSKLTFEWNDMVDGNWKDYQTAWQIQIANDKNFTSIVSDTGKVLTNATRYTPSTALPDGSFYWHTRVWDNEDDAGSWGLTLNLRLDATPPSNPSYLKSTSHTPGVWSNVGSIDLVWDDGTDATSSLRGYSWATTRQAYEAEAMPDERSDIDVGTNTRTYGYWGDGDYIYFHLRAVDFAGNANGTALHAGPYRIDKTPPNDPTVTSSTHQDDFQVWSNLSVVQVNWTAASDVTSGVKGFATLWSQDYSADPNRTVILDSSVNNATSPDLPDGTWYFIIDTMDNAGNWADAGHFGPVNIDRSLPNNPPALYSTSHSLRRYSNDTTIDVRWGLGHDEPSGVQGYSYCWDDMPDTLPDEVMESDDTINYDTSPLLADGASHYFHVRTVDRAGNWNRSALHLGPFWIDSTGPGNPLELWSPSHRPGEWSSDTTVEVNWSVDPSSDPLSGCEGFSFAWDTGESTIPDTQMDVGNDTKSATSPPLEDGRSWFFHIRARDRAGNWATETVHLGPFCIDTTPPSNPNRFAGTSHKPEEWSRDDTIDVTWAGAADPSSGIGGYSYLWDELPYSIPGKTVVAGPAANSTSSGTLADGRTWYFHLRTVDRVGNWATAAIHLGPYYIDSSPPALVLFEINNNATITNRSTVTLALVARDPVPGTGVTAMRFSTNGIDWLPWQAFSPGPRMNLTSEGAHTLYAQVQDGVGNAGMPLMAGIILDTRPPSRVNVTVKNGDAFTRSPAVQVRLVSDDGQDGTGVAEISLRLEGKVWSPWQPYAEDIMFELPIGDGLKNISARARDRAGNIGEPGSDTISFDTTPPASLSLKFAGGLARTAIRTVPLQLGAVDPPPASGMGEMSFSEDGTNWTVWEPFSATRQYTFSPGDGARTLYFRARDRALNAAEPVNAGMLIDTQPPMILKVEVAKAGTDNATIRIELDEPAAALIGYGLNGIGEANSSSTIPAVSHQMILTGLVPGKIYRYRVSATDAFGNGPSEGPELTFSTTRAGLSHPGTPAGSPPAHQEAWRPDAQFFISVILTAVIIAAGVAVSRRLGRK